MGVELTPELIERFVKARQDLHLTQLALSNQAPISLRTIKDIESGRRTSFNESTLIILCRALKLDYQELFGNQLSRGKVRRKISAVAALGLLLAAIILALILKGVLQPTTGELGTKRIDWVREKDKLGVVYHTPDWGNENGINVNYFDISQLAATGETVPVEIKWSYHFVEGSTPIFYISAYSEWEPDEEISIFEGTLQGESSDTLNFEITVPDEPGIYTIRVFFASAFGPISSYYGHSPPNQIPFPSTARYLEIPIEVIRK